MADIRPFRAIRYTSGALSDVLAPPYDVLDQADRDALVARDANNFVVIDLPHIPPKNAGPAEVYEKAAKTLQDWLDSGVMKQDERPAIYVYHQQYEHAGRAYTRKMFFARLKLEEFGKGSVFPHEQTFGGPKEDRLALMKTTRAQLSPIFGLYPDAENAVAQRLERGLAKPTAEGVLDGVDSRLWVVTDQATIDATSAAMADKPIYIADGHHRYGTALLYREWKRQKGDVGNADYVLTVFCAMEDPGALILPTHRVLAETHVPLATLAADANLRLEPLSGANADNIDGVLAKLGPQAVAVFDPEKGWHSLLPAKADLLDSLEPGHSEAWRRLALAVLHAYVLDRVITAKACGGTAPKIEYIKSTAAAVDYAKSHKTTAFVMQASTMSELRDVCGANDLMPQKSTYFYPKLASGLVINPLA
ncbi:MAG: DUF1015 domain-containing protein [Phycisphaerales bacterium]|nr:DUF1015 domain-containing protein [Phycisphaerales bacterium]